MLIRPSNPSAAPRPATEASDRGAAPAQAMPPSGGAILVEASDDLAERLWRLAQASGEPPEALAADLIRRGLDQQSRRERAEASLEALTRRQREVTRLAVGGQTNRQIARALWLSPETVKTHLRRALEHFDVHSKAELRLLLIDLDGALPSRKSEWPDSSNSSSAAPSNPLSARTTTD